MGRGRLPSGDERERAVTPVIGVVLLVAIVVILAGTVSYFVLGVDTGREPTPTFSKVEDYDRNTAVNGQYLNVTHGSGENVDTQNMTILVEDAVVRDRSSDALQGQAKLKSTVSLSGQVGDEWVADESLSIHAGLFEEAGGTFDTNTEYLGLREATIKIVWVPQNEGYSDVIYRWDGPNA